MRIILAQVVQQTVEKTEREKGEVDKLMGRYGSEKSRKDKEEKDTHFGTMVDCSWLLSNFGRFRCRKEKDECREKCNNKWANGVHV